MAAADSGAKCDKSLKAEFYMCLCVASDAERHAQKKSDYSVDNRGDQLVSA